MPPPPSPYVLEQRLALPDQDWQPVGRYGALESAAEDARWPLPRPAEGTLRRVTLGRYTVWIGVADDQGEVLPLPTVATRTGYRTPPGRVKDWLAAWYGPKADWRYMLDQAHGVEREWLVALALVFAERALAVREASDPPLRDGAHARSLIEATRAWLRGEGGPGGPRRPRLGHGPAGRGREQRHQHRPRVGGPRGDRHRKRLAGDAGPLGGPLLPLRPPRGPLGRGARRG